MFKLSCESLKVCLKEIGSSCHVEMSQNELFEKHTNIDKYNQKNKKIGEYSRHRKDYKCIQNFTQKTKRKHRWPTDGSVVLNWVSNT
jgi:hypothetical protein